MEVAYYIVLSSSFTEEVSTMKHDFMSHDLHLPELTLRGMLLGALITVILQHLTYISV